jgi:hypothetical protein
MADDASPTTYIVAIDKGDDLVIQDDHLTLRLAARWAVFHDPNGVALAIPADRIRSIQRLDQPHPTDQGP